jgi:signal transduction histidine kinase
MARGGGVSDLITRVGSQAGGARMRDQLADALEDPSLELAYWLPQRGVFVTEDGRETDLPEHHPGRSVTEVTREGELVAAVVHDPALDDSLDLVRGAGAAVALALENERLDAELRARVEELRASRERLVRAGLDERRRLERDLHDGAQQRLVSLRLALGLLRRAGASDPDRAERLVDGAMGELDAALAELRELARGIHPGVLSDHGLEPALAALADRAPLPVEVQTGVDRLPQAVESAAYFTVAEALTNVAKYAHAHTARVTVESVNGHVVVEIRDDGVGGADPSRGTGLRGLSDRVSALGGRLDVDSPAGAGTALRAEIPCA